jgi:phosphoribosylglycinamide formyltransferase 1
MVRLKVGVFISGRGSNLQALIDATVADPTYPAEIVLVISNNPDAAGLQRAARAGIAHAAIPHPSRAEFATAADAALRRGGVELVALAGFMRLLDGGFVAAWRDRLMNIHPSLLPAFPGLRAQRQALLAGVRFAGCTVHFVREAVDTGPIIAQAVVPVLQDDDEARLSQRILAAEHRVYPMAVRLFAQGKLRIADGRVSLADDAAAAVAAAAAAAAAALYNPPLPSGGE